MNSAFVLQEKKRLEEALLELQRVNESLLDAAHSSAKDRPEGAVVYFMSAESAQLLGSSEAGSGCTALSVAWSAAQQPHQQTPTRTRYHIL